MNHYSIHLSHIPVFRLHDVWSHVRSFIESALLVEEYAIDDVLMKLIEGRFSLFVVVEGETYLGAATVEVQEFPRETVGVVVHMGAKNLERVLPFLSEIGEWCKEQGATRLRVCGRKGWERVLSEKFQFRYACVECEL